MSVPWTPERALTATEAGQMIEKQFPELKPVTLQMLGEGFDNSVFLVNHFYVFRFPRREIAAELIGTENRLLRVLAPELPISVPNPQFQGIPNEDYPWPFAGYAMIDGKPPSRLTLEQRLLSAELFARFLRVLHDFPVEEAKSLKIPFDEIGRMDISIRKPKLEENIVKALRLNVMDINMSEQIKRLLETVPKDSPDDRKVLVHGDLHYRNMLVDDAGIVSGVIDWGDTHIGHPAVDLSIAYSYLPPSGRDLFFREYGEVSDDVKRLARFKAVYTTVLLLLYGHDLHDHDLVNESQKALNIALMD